MSNVCHDNILYYYILNSKKIGLAIGIVLFVIALFVFLIICFKKKEITKKDFIRSIIILLFLFCIPVGIIYAGESIKNHTDYTSCIEEEEQKAIEETDISPAKYVSHPEKRKVEKNIEEKIEIVEGEELDESEKLIYDNQFYFLNVGAGTESFIIEDQGHFGLIDTSYDSKAKFILNQLKKLGAKELDFLIITHSHLDHMGGYDTIMSNISVKTLYIKNPGNVNSDYVPTYLKMINKAEEKGTAICDVKEEICQSFYLGNVVLQLYNTEFYTAKGIQGLDRSRVENANSIAVLATINNRKIYFASDLGDYDRFKSETNTAQQIGDIDIYKVAHHGYISYNNSVKALSILKPEYSIITNNKELSLTAMKRIKKSNPDYQKTFYTTDGTIILHINGDGSFEWSQ